MFGVLLTRWQRWIGSLISQDSSPSSVEPWRGTLPGSSLSPLPLLKTQKPRLEKVNKALPRPPDFPFRTGHSHFRRPFPGQEGLFIVYLLSSCLVHRRRWPSCSSCWFVTCAGFAVSSQIHRGCWDPPSEGGTIQPQTRSNTGRRRGGTYFYEAKPSWLKRVRAGRSQQVGLQGQPPPAGLRLSAPKEVIIVHNSVWRLPRHDARDHFQSAWQRLDQSVPCRSGAAVEPQEIHDERGKRREKRPKTNGPGRKRGKRHHTHTHRRECVCSIYFWNCFISVLKAAASDKGVMWTLLLLLTVFSLPWWDCVAVCQVQNRNVFSRVGPHSSQNHLFGGSLVIHRRQKRELDLQQAEGAKGKIQPQNEKRSVSFSFKLQVLSLNDTLGKRSADISAALSQPAIPNQAEKQHQGLKESRTGAGSVLWAACFCFYGACLLLQINKNTTFIFRTRGTGD